MTHVFTLDAIARCESRGRHVFSWRWSWHDVGFDECTDCGATGPVGTRPRAPVTVPVDAGAADDVATPRAAAAGDDTARLQRNAYMRELLLLLHRHTTYDSDAACGLRHA